MVTNRHFQALSANQKPLAAPWCTRRGETDRLTASMQPMLPILKNAGWERLSPLVLVAQFEVVDQTKQPAHTLGWADYPTTVLYHSCLFCTKISTARLGQAGLSKTVTVCLNHCTELPARPLLRVNALHFGRRWLRRKICQKRPWFLGLTIIALNETYHKNINVIMARIFFHCAIWRIFCTLNVPSNSAKFSKLDNIILIT